MKTFFSFSQNSFLHQNFEKCETVVIEFRKVCGMKCISLCTDTIKISRVIFLKHKIKQNEKTLTKIQNVIKSW